MKAVAPCEKALWSVLPAIRREVVYVLVKEKGMSQKEVARILGITEAAVSNYMRRKRGKQIRLPKEVREEIRRIATKIANTRNVDPLNKKICKLCKCVTEG